MNNKDRRLYNREHLWCLRRANNTAIIGISEQAQRYLGEITWIWLPDAGSEIARGEVFASIESSGPVDALVSPLDGRIININNHLRFRPDTVNRDPYGEGWLLHVQLEHAGQLDGMMDARQYMAYIDEIDGDSVDTEPKAASN